MIYSVAKQVLTAAGGAQTIRVNNSDCHKYHLSFRSVGATPLAGTTAVAATQKNGTEETVTDSAGVAINMDPTTRKAITLASPIESVKFTPNGWTAGVEIICEIFGET